MPPKNKKSAKRNKSKNKKSPVKLVFKEVVMAKQLEVKEQHINEMKKYLDELKLQNEHQKQKNLLLTKEQNVRIQEVVNQALKISKEEDAIDHISFSKVEEALADKFNAIQISMNDLEEMRGEIVKIEKMTKEFTNDLEQLKNYQAYGKFKDQARIDDLLQEIEDMEASYKEIENFFQRSFSSYKNVVMKQNDESLTQHKKLASERVFSDLEKHDELEFLDNKWLLKEVGIHHQHVINVTKDLESLERTNIELISSLFDQNNYENWNVGQDIKEIQNNNDLLLSEEISGEVVEFNLNQLDNSPLDPSLYVLGTKLALHGLQIDNESVFGENNHSSRFK
ncbi:uncharacterized protein LOC105848266 isoform X1 [Hydra vulgaris]|uniref:uncharacterized protein LOC105848266 isoform X1 n=1 Tax=Hydra vulgaris TaxID=6087 RepID=UPI0006416DE9